MPPKKETPANDDTGSSTSGNALGLSQSDLAFLLDCLKCPSGGAVSIDVKAVAELRNQKNPKSIANRIAALKKKHNLPITTSSHSAGASHVDPTGPVTPSKVTKSRAKTPKRVVKKGTDEAVDEEHEEKAMPDAEDEKMDDEQDDMA